MPRQGILLVSWYAQRVIAGEIRLVETERLLSFGTDQAVTVADTIMQMVTARLGSGADQECGGAGIAGGSAASPCAASAEVHRRRLWRYRVGVIERCPATASFANGSQ